MYRFDVRADNIPDQGPVIIIEATPLVHKLVATFTRETAQAALHNLGLSEIEIRPLLETFTDGKERMVNVEANAGSLTDAGFL